MPLDPNPIWHEGDCSAESIGKVSWVSSPSAPGGGFCIPNCWEWKDFWSTSVKLVPIIDSSYSPTCACGDGDLTCSKCYPDSLPSYCPNDAICVKWPDQTKIPWTPLLSGITYSGSVPTETLGNASRYPSVSSWFSYEIIPGLT